MRLLVITLTSLALLHNRPAAAADHPKSIFFVGNSVTDTVNYNGLVELAKSRGLPLNWARHMIPGAPIFLMWEGKDGFIDEKFGPAQQALSEHAWDVISVQPFDRHFRSEDGSEGDLEVILKMIDAQIAINPKAQFYVFSRWPRMATIDGSDVAFDKNDYDPKLPGNRPDLSTIRDWHELWTRPYTGQWDNSNESKDYFEQLVDLLRQERPNLAKPVLMIPVGDVFDALGKKIAAGKVPGFDNLWLLYKDGIHMNSFGSYLTAITVFATIFRQDPTGLQTEPYGDISPEIAKIFQQTVWEVVREHPYAGVAQN